MQSPGNRRAQFRECQVTTLKFPSEALEPLRELYGAIRAQRLPKGLLVGRKTHENFPGLENVNMHWLFANSPAAIKRFRTVVDTSSLAEAREIIGERPESVRVVQASFIETFGGYPIGRWHSDFTDDDVSDGQSGTMLTPLFPFQRNFGGLELTVVKRGMRLEFDQFAHIYRYREGEAVLFDGSGMIHRTQRYRARAAACRVLVCWQFAEINKTTCPALTRIGARNGDPMFLFHHPATRM